MCDAITANLCCRPATLLAPASQHHVRAALSQLARCGIANASIGTCHDAHLIAELQAANAKQECVRIG
jgi:hypothetical protein